MGPEDIGHYVLEAYVQNIHNRFAQLPLPFLWPLDGLSYYQSIIKQYCGRYVGITAEGVKLLSHALWIVITIKINKCIPMTFATNLQHSTQAIIYQARSVRKV